MLRRLVERARDGLRHFGLDVTRYPDRGSVAWGLTRLLDDLAINIVLDVGAHYGEYGTLLRRIGYRGRIVSFEPVPASFERLRACAMGDPHWQVHQIALGAADGEQPFNVTAATDLSSFLVPDAAGISGFDEWARVTDTIPVRVARLDKVLDEHLRAVPHPAVFLKCDTQGYDWQVLDGAGACLADVRGLQLELSAIPLYHGMRSLTESLTGLQTLGFSVFGLYAVAHDPQTRQVLEFDCLAQRTRA